MMRRWQGIILIVLSILASTAAGYAGSATERADKIAPPAVQPIESAVPGSL